MTSSLDIPHCIIHPGERLYREECAELTYQKGDVCRSKLKTELLGQIFPSSWDKHDRQPIVTVVWGYIATGKTHLVKSIFVDSPIAYKYKHVFWIRTQHPELIDQDFRFADATIAGTRYMRRYQSMLARRIAEERVAEMRNDPRSPDWRPELDTRYPGDSEDPALYILRSPTDRDDPLDIVKRRVFDWVSRQKERCLWILDGVNHAIDVNAFMPNVALVDHVITTRRLPLRNLATGKPVDLGPLSSDEAIEMWRAFKPLHTAHPNDEQHVLAILEAVGYSLGGILIAKRYLRQIVTYPRHTLEDVLSTASNNLMLLFCVPSWPTRTNEVYDTQCAWEVLDGTTVENYLQCGLDTSDERWVSSQTRGLSTVLESYHPRHPFGRFILRCTILNMLSRAQDTTLWSQLHLTNLDEGTMEMLIATCDTCSSDLASPGCDNVYGFLGARSSSINLVANDETKVSTLRPFLAARSYFFRRSLSPSSGWNQPVAAGQGGIQRDIDMRDLDKTVVELLSDIVCKNSLTALHEMTEQVQRLSDAHYEQLEGALLMYGIINPDFQLPERAGFGEHPEDLGDYPGPPIRPQRLASYYSDPIKVTVSPD